MRPLRAVLVAAALALPAPCQTTPPAPQLSPKAAYDEAMHPLDVTRRSFANWSDTELAAMRVAIASAAKDCAARDAKSYTGATLLDYAHLCGLGQAWPAVVEAASRYIAEDTPAKPQLDQAYSYLIHAELYLKLEPPAFEHAKTMLATVPYNPITAETLGEAMEYMQFVHTSDALTLGTLRQPLLMARLTATAATDAKPGTTASAEPQQPIHELYAAGLAFAALQQLAKSPPTEIAATVAALDAALPARLDPDDALPIADARHRYALLGKPLPKIAATAYLAPPNLIPRLPASHAVTALLLFPDWCAQCLHMGKQFPETVFTVSGIEAYFFALLAETVPPSKQPPDANAAFNPADASFLLRETPTLVVSPETLTQFSPSDIPFLILTDSTGIVRVVQPVGDDVLARGGILDSAIARVGAQWPRSNILYRPPHPAPPATTPPHP